MAFFISEIIFFIWAVTIGLLSIELGIGSMHQPGPGLWPLILSTVMLVLTIRVMWNKRKYSKDQGQLAANILRPLQVITALAVYLFCIPLSGYFISTLLLMLFWLRFFGLQGWKVSVITAVSATAVFWLLFAVCLEVPLPLGIFE